MNDPKPKKLKLDNIVCIEPAEKGFLSELYKYMKDQNTPIGRIPSLGFKEGNAVLLKKVIKNLTVVAFCKNRICAG